VDRPAMNAAMFRALRPGGSLVVIDHLAAPGTASEPASAKEVAETLHRMDEALLRSELEAAGFQFAGEAEFLRNADDARDAPFFRMDGPTDAFVHRYTRP
jgi:predicted methyltransferase